MAYQSETQDAHSNSGNPPANKTGQNGTSCAVSGCHQGGAAGMGEFGIDIDVDVLNSMGQLANSYLPGETYEMTVYFNAPFETYGFALSSDSFDGQFVSTGSTAIDNTGATQQIEHSGVNTSGSWTFDWIAPPADEGELTFYLGAIGGNGNGNNNGDTGFEGTFTLTPEAADCPTNPVASVSATDICVGESVTAIGQVTGGTADYTWTINPASGTASGNQLNLPNETCSAISYEITLTAACEDGSLIPGMGQETTTVTVWPQAENFVEILQSGGCVTEVAIAGNCPDIEILGDAMQEGQVDLAGVHSYSVGAPSAGNCLATIEVPFNCESVGTEQVQAVSLLAYPQPGHELITVEATGIQNELASISIVDLTGKVVFEKRVSVNSESIQLDISTVATGFYLLQLSTAKSSVSNKLTIAR